MIANGIKKAEWWHRRLRADQPQLPPSHPVAQWGRYSCSDQEAASKLKNLEHYIHVEKLKRNTAYHR